MVLFGHLSQIMIGAKEQGWKTGELNTFPNRRSKGFEQALPAAEKDGPTPNSLFPILNRPRR